MIKNGFVRRRTVMFAALFLFALSQSLTASDSVDAVVMLDSSESMFPYFDETKEYLVSDIMGNQLDLGDSFHLLSFSDTPEYEISRVLKGRDEIKAISARLLLLQALGQHTDLVAAMKRLYDYTADLPLESQKELFLLSDGVHDPPENSPYPVSSQNDADIADIAASMRSNGWKLHIIRFPSGSSTAMEQDIITEGLAETREAPLSTRDDKEPGTVHTDTAPSSSGTADAPAPASSQEEQDRSQEAIGDQDSGKELFSTIEKETGEKAVPFRPADEHFSYKAAGQLELRYPADLGKIKDRFTLPLEIHNHLNKPSSLEIDDVQINGTSGLNKSIRVTVKADDDKRIRLNLRLPKDLEPGKQQLSLELFLANGERAYPREALLSAEILEAKAFRFSIPHIRPILIVVILLILLVLAIIVIRRSFRFQQDKAGEDLTERQERLESVSRTEQDALLNGMKKEHLRSFEPIHAQEAALYRRQHKHISSTGLYSKDEIAKARGQGKIAIEMLVEEQNRLIGKRNITWMQKGEIATVGGRSGSDFLVFLYHIPEPIGTLERREDSFIFIPSNYSKFPQLNAPLEKCLNREIVYRFRDDIDILIRFHHWISPLERLNQQLHVIDEPGLPDNKE